MRIKLIIFGTPSSGQMNFILFICLDDGVPNGWSKRW